MSKIAEVLVVSIGGGHKLAVAFEPRWRALNAHAKRVFGVDIPIKSAWRSNARQAALYALYKAGLGNLALPPGKSTHNKGTGIDVAGRFAQRGTREHDWLVANGPTYGVHWTGRNFSQIEPWHFDYLGGGKTDPIEVSNPAPSVPGKPAAPTLKEEDMDQLIGMKLADDRFVVLHLGNHTYFHVADIRQWNFLQEAYPELRLLKGEQPVYTISGFKKI